MERGYRMTDYKKILDELRLGEIQSVIIKKEEFLQFREYLIKDEQFKNFRGEAKQGGDIVYTFSQNSRT